MIFDVLVYRIDTTYDQPSGKWNSNLGPVNLTAGNYLHTRLDNVTNTLSVDYRSSESEDGGSYMGTLTEGPNLFFGFNGAATLVTTSPYYQYCDGTALRKVGTGAMFPYGSLSYEPGAAECVIAPVCDLTISPFYSYDHVTSPTANDGFITVFASSSNGVVKYALNNPTFDYLSQGQISSTFTGLSPQVYTVYAKDPIGCQDTIVIEIKVNTTYGVKYRLEFQDSLVESSRMHRIDILERSYTGDIMEMCGGGDPVHDKWNGDSNDPNKTVIPSEFNLQILKETFGTYTELFTDDERKFRIYHYTVIPVTFDATFDESFADADSVDVYWTGYVLPEFNNEPWVFEPYELTISGTDGLGDMKAKPFVDENGNKFKGDQKAIKLIAAILKKCDLDLPIRCGLNIFSVEMTSAITDDPLDQAYIDTRIFQSTSGETDMCDVVLDKILAPFRANICQSNGYWWIRRLSDAVGIYTYREFDIDGDYDSNSTFNPKQDLDFPTVTNRAAWANKSAFLSHLRNYGYFNIIHNLGKDNNLIDEGRFEFDDIEEVGSGNQFFKNWNFFMGQPGVKFGFENVLNGESKGAFFADFETATGAQADSKLYSVQVPFSSGQGLVKIRFQYFIEPRFAGLPYVRLGWSVKVTNGTESDWMKSEFPPEFSRGNNGEEIINEIYVTNFSTWNTFELTSTHLAVSQPATIEVTFYMHNHYGRDFPNINNLKAFSISDLDDPLRLGKKVMVAEGGLMYVYTSAVDPTTVESLPDVVHPDDYANDYLWNLDKVVNVPPNVGIVKKVMIDNVSISYYPNVVVSGINRYIDPPETQSYSEEVSTFVKSNLEKEVFLGDMIRFNDELEDNERYIYKGYFRTSDGSPTTVWTRTGVVESKPLLTITKEDYRDQFRNPTRKFSGTFFSDIIWHFVNSVQENFEGSRYQFQTFDFDAKKSQYTIEMCAVETGDDGEPPVNNGAYDPTQHDDSHDIS